MVNELLQIQTGVGFHDMEITEWKSMWKFRVQQKSKEVEFPWLVLKKNSCEFSVGLGFWLEFSLEFLRVKWQI